MFFYILFKILNAKLVIYRGIVINSATNDSTVPSITTVHSIVTLGPLNLPKSSSLVLWELLQCRETSAEQSHRGTWMESVFGWVFSGPYDMNNWKNCTLRRLQMIICLVFCTHQLQVHKCKPTDGKSPLYPLKPSGSLWIQATDQRQQLAGILELASSDCQRGYAHIHSSPGKRICTPTPENRAELSTRLRHFGTYSEKYLHVYAHRVCMITITQHPKGLEIV